MRRSEIPLRNHRDSQRSQQSKCENPASNIPNDIYNASTKHRSHLMFQKLLYFGKLLRKVLKTGQSCCPNFTLPKVQKLF